MNLSTFVKPDEDQTNAALKAANEFPPTIKSWILFSTDAFSGAGATMWFEDKMSLIDFLDKYPFLFGSSDLSESELEEVDLIRHALASLAQQRNGPGKGRRHHQHCSIYRREHCLDGQCARTALREK